MTGHTLSVVLESHVVLIGAVGSEGGSIAAFVLMVTALANKKKLQFMRP